MYISNKIITFSILTIIISFVILKNKNISSGSYLGILIGIIISIYYFMLSKEKVVEDENIRDKMLEEIKHPIYDISEYPELINFLFWIQDFNNFNKATYEELVNLINEYIILYEEGILADSGKRYNMMVSKKNLIINTLHSFIYSIPINITYKEKLEKTMKKLDGILQFYLDEVEKKYKETIKNRYNNETVMLIKDVYPNNFYLDNQLCIF